MEDGIESNMTSERYNAQIEEITLYGYRSHFIYNKYNYLLGKFFINNNIQIKNIIYEPDELYIKTRGRDGLPYKIFLSNKVSHNFKYLKTIIEIYGNISNT